MDVEKFKKYIGQPASLELEADDGTKETFELKPLPFEYVSELLMIGKAFAKIPTEIDTATGKEKEIPAEKFLEILDEGTIQRMQKLVKATLKSSYPELPEEIIDGFATRNFLTIVTKIFEINSMGGKTEAVQKRLEAMRAARNK